MADLDDDVGVFGFPPVEAGGENPVLGGGDLADDARRLRVDQDVMKLLAETDIGNEAAKHSSFISPHKDFDTGDYPNELTEQMAEVAYDSTAFLFDGSDQMPGEVGAGSFWKEMTAWISGPAGSRHRAEEHRRQLAVQLSQTVTDAGGAEARRLASPALRSPASLRDRGRREGVTPT